MHILSSIHRLSENPERDQGLAWWHQNLKMTKNLRKLTSPGSNVRQNQQITFADANRPHVIKEVTRRDGLPRGE